MSLGLGMGLWLGHNPGATSGGGGGAAASTWNPADKSASITLSNGNLSAQGAGGGFYNARATNGKTSGKWYFEGSFGTGISNDAFGISNASANLNAFLGTDGNSAGYYNSNFVGYNATSTTYATYTVGDVIGVAVDLTGKKLWFSKNGTWQSGDPATGVGGIDITFLTGTVYPTVGADSTAVGTGNFGATSFNTAAPSGFTAWG